MYTIEEYDQAKTKVLKYIMFKKRTEYEIKQKFSNCDNELLEDVIEELKENGYISDNIFIEKQINEYIKLKTLSLKEIKYKLMQKGINKNLIDDYIAKHEEELQQYEQESIEKIKKKKQTSMEEEGIQNYLYKRGFKGV